MSTMETISEQDIDRPPAGTWCSVCKAAGHFCQATCYSGFGEDTPYCEGCDGGVPCARNKALAPVETTDLEPDAVNDYQSAPARVVIPKEEWPADTSIHETKHNLAEVPFGIRTEIRAEQNGTAAPQWKREFLVKNFMQCADFFTRISGTLVNAVHDAAIRAVDPSWFIVEETEAGSRMLLDKPIFNPDREPAAAKAKRLADAVPEDSESVTYHLNIYHSGKKIPATTGVSLCGCGKASGHKGRCPGIPSGSGRKVGDNYKQPQRDAAAELLQAGKSIRETAAEVGLSKNIVIDVKKETPGVPTKANNGGMPMHKPKEELTMESPMDHEVSVERRESVKVSTRTSPNFGANPVLVALLQYLPPVGEEFTINQRVKWLQAAISMFELLYTAPDSEDWMLHVDKDSLR